MSEGNFGSSLVEEHVTISIDETKNTKETIKHHYQTLALSYWNKTKKNISQVLKQGKPKTLVS